MVEKSDYQEHNANYLFNNLSEDPKIKERWNHSKYYKNKDNYNAYQKNKFDKMKFTMDELNQYQNLDLVKADKLHRKMMTTTTRKEDNSSLSMIEAKQRPQTNCAGSDYQNEAISRAKNNSVVVKNKFERLAGKDSESLTTERDRAFKVARETARDYSNQSEVTRKIHYTNMQLKDHKYYNKKDSLWNEP